MQCFLSARARPLLALLLVANAAIAAEYVPQRGAWETIEPQLAGFDAGRLQAAVDYARSQAVTEPADLHEVITAHFGPREPGFRILGPTGTRASTTWRWHGYENSWIELDGLRMQSVSGGGHFGGGVFISTEDHARFGLLFLRRGQWGGEQLFPAEWLEAMRANAPDRPDYGYLWWLNTGRERIPAAPE